MASKYVHVIRKPKDWKDLHPAPRVAVEERNCCDCIFAINPLSWTVFCNLHNEQRNNHDECGAFTKRNEQESEPKP